MANAPLPRGILQVTGEGNVMVHALGTAPVSLDLVRALGALERLSADLDYGHELDYYDGIDGFVWKRGDRLAVYVRPDKLPPVVLRLADDEAVRGSGPAADSTPTAASGQLDQPAEVQVP
jgi:hypothetical protein